MMPETVFLHRDDEVVIISPAGAPTVHDAMPGLDTLVLEVIGGHLSWGLLSEQTVPAAVLHDPDAAQEWLWAVYGEPVALAVADGRSGELLATSARPELAEAARQLGYAQWAAHWWPASTIDGIPALDSEVLGGDIAALTEACESIVDGADAQPSPVGPSFDAAVARRQDYALAAGPAGPGRTGLVLATGTSGWDWRRCPAGVLDASEFAVSWRLTRESGSTSVEVRAAAAPHLDAGLPGHLWPRARVVTTAAPTDFGLQPNGDTWIGGAPIDAENVVRVDIYVPGVGPAIGAADSGYGPAQRQRIREFVVARLRTPGRSGLLLEAERVAAASDTDF
ncbi:hypothetical protein [Nocardia nova]|uniref:hypothetical protein n=1 Tax=Nocardia nova TaxID=37330 RepID=UPI001893D1DB|nr:hypothetical protein [Nocardia nova]MBF6146706.1 hypothetical protein [Nocardia nova]MDN2498948.1 hypothetical protein [Nocardia nova]